MRQRFATKAFSADEMTLIANVMAGDNRENQVASFFCFYSKQILKQVFFVKLEHKSVKCQQLK